MYNDTLSLYDKTLLCDDTLSLYVNTLPLYDDTLLCNDTLSLYNEFIKDFYKNWVPSIVTTSVTFSQGKFGIISYSMRLYFIFPDSKMVCEKFSAKRSNSD